MIIIFLSNLARKIPKFRNASIIVFKLIRIDRSYKPSLN